MWHGMACSVHIHHCDCDGSAGGYGRKAKRTELVTGKLLDPEDLCCSTTGKIVNVPKYAMRSIEGAVGLCLFFFSFFSHTKTPQAAPAQTFGRLRWFWNIACDKGKMMMTMRKKN
jgi:hypothetical protein